jgi:hypothetical protein
VLPATLKVEVDLVATSKARRHVQQPKLASRITSETFLAL